VELAFDLERTACPRKDRTAQKYDLMRVVAQYKLERNAMTNLLVPLKEYGLSFASSVPKDSAVPSTSYQVQPNSVNIHYMFIINL
jgi:hypothetical protein